VLDASNLDELLAEDAGVWAALNARVLELWAAGACERALVPVSEIVPELPFTVRDYVDFYSSEQHARNLGALFRPGQEPLPAAWKHLPIGYHGASGSVLVSGAPVRRPCGQRAGSKGPTFGPSTALDFELELGFVTGGPPTAPGEAVSVDEAERRIFGVVLVNDWSARDLQRWEYVPLGPFLGKSFATTIGAWVMPFEFLAAARVPLAPHDPPPLPYLAEREHHGFDIELEVELTPAGGGPTVISRTNTSNLYWSFAQQLAHATSNGAVARPGNLYASGTISGEGPGSRGSLVELALNGERPIAIGEEQRTFLEDGDTVTLRGSALNGSVRLAEARGTILPAAWPR
jgi:fumarylacetoacetase